MTEGYRLSEHPGNHADPNEQSLDCPQGRCSLTLVDLHAQGCERTLTHPIGVPQANIHHSLFINPFGPPDAGKDGLLKRLIAGHVQALRLLPQTDRQRAIPADPATATDFFSAHTVDGQVAINPKNPPCAIRFLPSVPGIWSRYVYLHPLQVTQEIAGPEKDGEQSSTCPRERAMTAVERLAASDALVIGLNGKRLCDRGDFGSQAALAPWAEILSQASGRLPPVWFCLLHADRLFRFLGGNTPQPFQMGDLDEAQFNAVMEGYVARATRLAVDRDLRSIFTLPWPKISYSTMDLPAAEPTPVAGLRTWHRAMVP